MLSDIQAVKESADLAAIVEDLTGQPRDRSGLYNCPVCGSGTGPNGTGALSIQGDKWHCFSCGRRGDVFDLAGHLLQTGNFAEKVSQVKEWAGIRDDLDAKAPQRPRRADIAPAPDKGTGEAVKRERGAVEEARRAISDPDAIEYLASRGIDAEAARRLGLGYDRKRRRVVIPFPGSDHYHTDRSIDHDGSGKYLKPKGLRQPLWNPEALERDLVIAVEGPMDALAVSLAGFGPNVVALCGTAWRPLVEEMKARRWDGVCLVALDDDGEEDAGDTKAQKGRYHQRAMVDALAEAGITATGIGPWAALGTKDASEAWARDPEAMAETLSEAVREGRERAASEREARESRDLEKSLERLNIVDAETAMQNVMLLTGLSDPVPTGIGGLDETLEGGLYPGLYVLGATSSMGKTTLLGQIADNVAGAGRPVIFATLEQSAEEMSAKALSRTISGLIASDGKLHDVSAYDLMRPSWRAGYGSNPVMSRLLVDACEAYTRGPGSRIRYIVASQEPTVADIVVAATYGKRLWGQAPLIVVDYLQILAAPDDSLSDKQAVDRNVSSLRRLARDIGSPVLAVSSLNRASYSGAVTMESFKESGSIEYGSDVLLGLQPRKMAESVEGKSDKEAAKEGRRLVNETKLRAKRNVELTVLKNRWGRITGYADGIALIYHAITNRFTEGEALADPDL